MNTTNQEQKPVSEMTRKELKEIAAQKMNEQKEQLKKDLENVETIYVSYLNNQGTEMMFYYIVEEEGRKPSLTKVWISRPYIFENHEVIDLDFKDKPHSWEKSRSGKYHYCFRATGYGYSKKDHCLDSLYSWLYGYGVKKTPRIEDLN